MMNKIPQAILTWKSVATSMKFIIFCCCLFFFFMKVMELTHIYTTLQKSLCLMCMASWCVLLEQIHMKMITTELFELIFLGLVLLTFLPRAAKSSFAISIFILWNQFWNHLTFSYYILCISLSHHKWSSAARFRSVAVITFATHRTRVYFKVTRLFRTIKENMMNENLYNAYK